MEPQSIAEIRLEIQKNIKCINFRIRDTTTNFDYLTVSATQWKWTNVVLDSNSLASVQGLLLNDTCTSTHTLDADEEKYVLLSSKEELEYFKVMTQTAVINVLKLSYNDSKKKVFNIHNPEDDIYQQLG